MGNKQKTLHKLIACISILLLAFIIIHLRRRSGQSRYLYDPLSMIKTLPKFNTVDIDGNQVRSSYLQGRNIYIQFVDQEYLDDIELFSAVYHNWRDENIRFLAITNNIENFKEKIASNDRDIVVVNRDYEDLKRKFVSPFGSSTHYIVDENGNIFSYGKNSDGYEKGPKVFLKQLIKNEYFSISDFIKVNENVKEISWLEQVEDILRNNKKDYYIVSLFTKICDTCSGGLSIGVLKKKYSERKDTIYIIGLLHNSYSEDDLSILKSQLEINFDMSRADNILSEKWDSLISQFREDDLTDIVFIMDKSGRILKVMDRSCRCSDEFYDYVFAL